MTERAAAVDNAEAFLVRSASNGGWDAYRRERREPPSSILTETQIADVRDDAPLQDEALIARHRHLHSRHSKESRNNPASSSMPT